MLGAFRGRSRWPPADVAALQLRQARALVAHAAARVPFHRRQLAAAGIGPATFRTLADFARLPTTAKDALRTTPLADLIVEGVDPAHCETVHTSGSTGMPLRLVRGRHEREWQRAAGLRILRELGYRFTDRILEIRAVLGPTFLVQRLGLAPKRWLSILEPPSAQLRALREYRPQVVCAAGSSLDDLARAVLDAGAAVDFVRVVIADAETLLPSTRALVTRAFGAAPFDVYGLVELSDFAWECERHDGLHVSADTHLVEIVDDGGRPVPPGSPGRIVCTDLVARTMPMLRYETGDSARLVDEPCACGRTFPRLMDLVGRAGDVIRLPNGRRLHWPWFHETFARLADVDRYQVIQETMDRVRIRVRTAPDRHRPVVEHLTAELRTVIPATVQLEFEPWEAEPSDPTRKYRPVLSRVSDA
jgi:phenylacetate-CoA ligase